MTRRRFPAHQQGVAIITALLLTTLAVTIVASLFWQQQVQVRSIENQRLQLQKQWILRGALDWAQLILRENARTSQGMDTLDDPWAVPLEDTKLDQYVKDDSSDSDTSDASDASISGNIVDAQSLFNLTNLFDRPNNQIDPDQVAIFEKLLTLLKISPDLASKTAQMIATTQDTGSANNGQPAQQMKISYVEDLLAIPGFTPGIVEKLKDYVVVLPIGGTKINVNTAPAEILAASLDTLSLSDATTLVAIRSKGHFRDPGDLLNRGHTAMAPDWQQYSGYFLVNGNVRLSRASLHMQTLVERDQNGTTRLVWTRRQ